MLRSAFTSNREHKVWQWVLRRTRHRIIKASDSAEMALERIVRDERRAAVCEVLAILHQAQLQPPPQRDPPRWISGKRLRIGQDEVSTDRLALLIVFILVGMYGILALQYVRTQTVAERNDSAVALVTAQDAVPVRLAPTSGFPGAANGTYWGRVGTEIAVLTVADLPPAPEGMRYRWWVRHADDWTSIGVAAPDATGRARLIAESPALTSSPDALQVTLEPTDASPTPMGPTVLEWSDR